MSVALWIDVFHQQNQEADVTEKGLTLTGFTSLVVKQRDEKAAADSAAAIAAEKQAAELAALQSEIKRQELELAAAKEEKITLLISKKNQAALNYKQLMDGLKGSSLDALETAKTNACPRTDSPIPFRSPSHVQMRTARCTNCLPVKLLSTQPTSTCETTGPRAQKAQTLQTSRPFLLSFRNSAQAPRTPA